MRKEYVRTKFDPENRNYYNEDPTTEEWRPVVIDGEAVDTPYIVSNFGNVKNKKTGRFLTPSQDKGGYLRVTMKLTPFKQRAFSIHRLVAWAFVPGYDPILRNEVNHINLDKNCNYPWNLEWVSRRDNIEHARRNNYKFEYKRGKDHPAFSMDDEQVDMLYDLLIRHPEYSNKKIARMTGIKYLTVQAIRTGKRLLLLSLTYGFTPVEAKLQHKNGFYEQFFDKIDALLRDGEYTDEIIKKVPIEGVSTVAYRSIIVKRRQRLIASGVYCPIYPRSGNLNITVDKPEKPHHYGEYSNFHMFTDDQIHAACKLLEENKLTQPEIAKITGVSRTVLVNLKVYKAWPHISKQYIMPEVKEFTDLSSYVDSIANLIEAGYKDKYIFKKLYPEGYGIKESTFMARIKYIRREMRKAGLATSSKHTKDEVDRVHRACRMLEENCHKLDYISEKTGVSKAMLSSIKAGKSWTSISSQYNIPKPRKMEFKNKK